MGNRNSLEIYISLTVHLFHDIAQCYSKSVEHVRDLKKLRDRTSSEGISFLTKTLPKLGKAIDTALSSDTPLQVSGFSLRPGTSIPRFLGWLIERVFTDEGYVRNQPDVNALKDIRQFLYFTYKLMLPYDKTDEKSTVESFVQTQQELENIEFPTESDRILDQAAAFLSRLFDGFNVRDIFPRHGPGAVATGEVAGEKSNFSRLYRSVEAVYPFTEYYTLGLNQVCDQQGWIQGLVELDTGTAVVVLVPKDSRGPRLISKEPLEIQWIQQGLRSSLYSWVEGHRLTRGKVNFTDQTINRRLALSSSRDSRYVTLDMKDASDRVTTRLVDRLFRGTVLLEALLATRSTATRLPDGREVPLTTFAPMGSAVCFPIEALCFYALIMGILQTQYEKFYLTKDRFGLLRKRSNPNVYVYGDDIILRREDFASVMHHFPSLGLKFNEAKCCVSGFFRESCGCDAFMGVDVTPIRMRKTWCYRGKRDPNELVSWVSLSNSLWDAGYWGTATAIQSMVEVRYGHLPYTREKVQYYDLAGRLRTDAPGLIGWYRSHVNHHVINRKRMRQRRFSRMHRTEIKTWVVKPKYDKYQVDGWQECLRSMLCGPTPVEYTGKPPIGKDSNVRIYAPPRRVCLHRGWVAE